MNTKEAIEFMENDILTLSIIDRKVDEFYGKIKEIVLLLKRGEKCEKIINKMKNEKDCERGTIYDEIAEESTREFADGL